jgi:hypothetical protein
MTPEEIKHTLETTVADKMKPVIKEILEMGGGRGLPKITDPRLLANKERVRQATAESPHQSLAEARAQTPGWQRAVLDSAGETKVSKTRQPKTERGKPADELV